MDPESPTESTGRTPSTREILGLGGLAAVVFGLGAAFLARRELWIDEAMSYLFARQSTGDLWSSATSSAGELNMIGYYLLLSPFAETSADEVWFRLPSVLAAIATVPLVWALTNRVCTDRFARVAATAVFLTQPMVIDYAFEARSYAFGMVATVGLTLLLVRALDGSTNAGIAYAGIAALAIAIHFVVLLLLAAHLLAVVVLTPGQVGRRLGAAARLLGPAMLVGAAAALVYRSQSTLGSRDPVGLRSVGSAVYSLTGRAGPLTFLFVAAVVFGGVELFRRRSEDPAPIALLFTVAVPTGMALILSVSRPLFNARYLLNLVPVLCCLVGIGIACALTSDRGRRIALVTFVVLGLAGQAIIYRTPDREQPDSATRFVLEHADGGDLVVFDSFYAAAPYQRYLDASGEDGPAQVGQVPDPDRPLRPLDLAPLAEEVRDLPAGGSVWIVLNRASEENLEEKHQVLADAGLEPVATEAFSSVSVEQWSRT